MKQDTSSVMDLDVIQCFGLLSQDTLSQGGRVGVSRGWQEFKLNETKSQDNSVCYNSFSKSVNTKITSSL